jgi:hypothetical protein
MPSTVRKLELKNKTSVAQTASQAAAYAKGLTKCMVQGAKSPVKKISSGIVARRDLIPALKGYGVLGNHVCL